MKKTYSDPKLCVFLIDDSDLLTLSNGGEGSEGMEGQWNQEIYY